jgi:hypothetical protein
MIEFNPFLFVTSIGCLLLVVLYHRLAARTRKMAADAVAEVAEIDTARTAWQSLALGLEVFYEATYDGDEIGILNAGTEIAAARAQLRRLGQYDA